MTEVSLQKNEDVGSKKMEKECHAEIEEEYSSVRSLYIFLQQNELNYYQNSVDIALLNMKHGEFFCSKCGSIKSIFSLKTSLYNAIKNADKEMKTFNNFLILHNRSGLKYFAKNMTPNSDPRNHNEKNIFNKMLMREGSLFYNDSPYVVRLLYLFFHFERNSFWYIFELCIANLENYFQMNKISLTSLSDKFYSGEPVVKEVIENFKIEYNTNLKRILWIYAFEILHAISYLASRNIVHGNMHPKNVMIDERGHLKLSDLGLNDRFRWEERIDSNTISIQNQTEWQEEFFKHCSLYYSDVEIILTQNNALFVTQWLNNNGFQCVLYKISDIKFQPPSFMSDAYNAAILILEIFMGGFSFTNSILINQCLKQKYKLINLPDHLIQKIWTIFITYHSEIHEDLVNNWLSSLDSTDDLHKLLYGFFDSRNKRCSQFTLSKGFNRNDTLLELRYINVEEIEKISIFKFYNINKETVRSLYIDINFTKHLLKCSEETVNVDKGCLEENTTFKSQFKIIPSAGWSNIFEYS